jgi:hypothetical protein
MILAIKFYYYYCMPYFFLRDFMFESEVFGHREHAIRYYGMVSEELQKEQCFRGEAYNDLQTYQFKIITKNCYNLFIGALYDRNCNIFAN